MLVVRFVFLSKKMRAFDRESPHFCLDGFSFFLLSLVLQRLVAVMKIVEILYGTIICSLVSIVSCNYETVRS